MRSINWLCGSLIAILAAGSIGCGQTFRPFANDGANTQLGADIDETLAKAEEATQAAKAAIDEANQLISQITDDNGNINIGLFTSSGSQKVSANGLGLIDPLLDELREVINKVYDKALFVKEQLAKARQALQEALAKIDQSNPANAGQVQMIMTQLAKLDQLEAQFSSSMHSLASKLDLAIAGLDGIIQGVITFIPGWGSLVGLALDFLVMSDVKALILELKMKLMSL